MEASGMKCLLCHQVIDYSDEKEDEMNNHMKTVHKAVFDVKLLIALHFLTPLEKVSMINKTDKMIREQKLKMTKKPNIIQNVLRRSIRKRNRSRSPRPELKSPLEKNKLEKSPKLTGKSPRAGSSTKSVFDKISIFEKEDKRKPQVDKGRQDLVSKNWVRIKPSMVPDVCPKVGVRIVISDAKESDGNDTLRNFDEMIADTTVNLDHSTTSFYDILEDNKIVDENCFDITISGIN